MSETNKNSLYVPTPDAIVAIPSILDTDKLDLTSAEPIYRNVEIVKEIQRKDDDGWHILGLRDAFQDADAPPWAIENLVMAQTVTLVSALPHAMKSVSWLYATIEAILKKEVFGHFPAPNLNNSLFIETEDPEWLVKKRSKRSEQAVLTKDVSYFKCPRRKEVDTCQV